MTTWILLRGLTRESRHWGPFPAELRSVLGDEPICMIDLPGAGRLSTTPSPRSIEAIADHCREQALALALQPPFNIVALSLGAMVAVAWAADHPDEVAGCVLINTSLRSSCKFWRRLRPSRYPALLRLSVASSDRTREAIIFDLTSTRRDNRCAIVDEWVAIRREQPVATANALRQLLAAARYRPLAPPPGTRMLVLASRGDALVDPVCSRRLAHAWGADYAEHPAAGHDLPLDDGPWIATRIGEWWQAANESTTRK